MWRLKAKFIVCACRQAFHRAITLDISQQCDASEYPHNVDYSSISYLWIHYVQCCIRWFRRRIVRTSIRIATSRNITRNWTNTSYVRKFLNIRRQSKRVLWDGASCLRVTMPGLAFSIFRQLHAYTQQHVCPSYLLNPIGNVYLYMNRSREQYKMPCCGPGFGDNDIHAHMIFTNI